ELTEPKFWFPELKLGVGVWSGKYQGAEGLWLRWYNENGDWIPNFAERVEQEKQRAEQEKQRSEQEKQRADSADSEVAKLRQLLLELRSLEP
ncbi:MAG: Uma2 family endonuclease, partial [Dolichospermum sp.]